MDGKSFRIARNMLGLTQAQMAAEIGVAGGRTVRRWESGDVAIPGPVEIVITYWLRDYESQSPRLSFS